MGDDRPAWMASVDSVISDIAGAMERVRRRQRRIVLATWCGTAGIGVAIAGAITVTLMLQGPPSASAPLSETCTILGLGCPSTVPSPAPEAGRSPDVIAPAAAQTAAPDAQPGTAPALVSSVTSRPPAVLAHASVHSTTTPPVPPPASSPSDPVSQLVSELARTLQQLGI